MKKMITAVAIVLSLISGTAFASGEENVSRRAKETFKKEFPAAEFAKWEVVEESDVYMVRFVSDDQGFVAYINAQGYMIASARIVTKENLPFKVLKVIRNKYNDTDILKIEELTMEETLSYFFTIEKGGKRMVLRIYHDGSIQRVGQQKYMAEESSRDQVK